jgi:tetratricopeptide (TPR) repeat protein
MGDNDGRKSEALKKKFKIVLRMQEKIFGEKSLQAGGMACFRIGECLFELEKISESLKFFLKCLEISRLDCGYRNLALEANVLSKISDCYEKLCDYEKFSFHWKQMVDVKRRLYKKSHQGQIYREIMLLKGKLQNLNVWCYILIRDEKEFLDDIKYKMKLEYEACDCGKYAFQNLKIYNTFPMNHESTPIEFGSKKYIEYYTRNLCRITCGHRQDKFLFFFMLHATLNFGLGKKPSTYITKEIEINYGFESESSN